MRSRDHVYAICLCERRAHVVAEQIPRPSRGKPPAGDVLGVAPKQIAHRAFVRHLLFTIDRSNLIDRRDARGQPPVHAKYLVIYERRQRKVIEHIRAISPHVDAPVFAQTLVVKPVHLRDLSTLVIPPNEIHSIRVPHLQRQEQQKRLHAVKPAIDEVPHEQIVCIRAVAADFKQFQQIVKLPVNVPAYRHRRIDRLHVRLFHQDLDRHLTQSLDVVFLQRLAFAQRRDPPVELVTHRTRARARAPLDRASRRRSTLVAASRRPPSLARARARDITANASE
mmetsp:Transcript_5811/g.22973  ORF Transcript_5811/g.22973 Transcript_5811/m.22973 type:complete len:281 (+) Transcript_5811:959-1801(+)